jgi:hypothetical protein
MRPADARVPAGRGWKVPIPADGEPAWAATLNAWIVNVPGAHPFWSWWQVSVVHLRDLHGVPPAHRRYPEAEYEFMIVAFDPDTPPDPDDRGGDGAKFLTPIDVVEQFHGIADAQAAQLCDGAVAAILRGRASPDQDYRSWWHACIRSSVEHAALGGHPKGGPQ